MLYHQQKHDLLLVHRTHQTCVQHNQAYMGAVGGERVVPPAMRQDHQKSLLLAQGSSFLVMQFLFQDQQTQSLRDERHHVMLQFLLLVLQSVVQNQGSSGSYHFKSFCLWTL